MKRLLFCLLLLAAPLEAPAQRAFNQAELDALLAPIALYPDALLMQVLVASTRPYDVDQAARWPRSAPPPQQAWHPAVEALLQYPDLLARMGENPQWVRDLGDAWMGNERVVLATVQQLRARAEATGSLRSDDQQHVRRQGDNIVVQPVVQQEVFYVPYYNPLVAYGNWWWTSYRPIVWRPWYRHPHPHPHARAAYVRVGAAPKPLPAPSRPLQVQQTQSHRPVQVAQPHHPQVQRVVVHNGLPSPAAQMQAVQAAAYADRQRALNQPSPAAVANRGQVVAVRSQGRGGSTLRP